MARPKIDETVLRKQILNEAEKQLASSNGKRLIMSDIADNLGISQPYAHRFFATKKDLLKGLVEKWFEPIEAECTVIVKCSDNGLKKLESYFLAILHGKRSKFDGNPALYMSYLELAKQCEDSVQVHVSRLRNNLREILNECVDEPRIDEVMPIIEDAMLLFRTPHAIALYRSNATDERAVAVLNALSTALKLQRN